MAVRRILQLGDPALRAISESIAPENAAEVIRDLEETLADFRAAHGFGRAISAIQIGVAVRVIFMRVNELRYELINPRLDWRSEAMFELWDDCFSFPELMVRLRRHREVRLAYDCADGSTRGLTATGDLSELIQHEMDHLDGVLAVDHALDGDSLCTRDEWLRRHAAG